MSSTEDLADIGGLLGVINVSSGSISIGYSVGRIEADNLTRSGAIAGSLVGVSLDSYIYYNTYLTGHSNAVYSGTSSALTKTYDDLLIGSRYWFFDIATHPTSKIWSIEFNGEDSFAWLTWQGAPFPLPSLTDEELLAANGYIPISNVSDLEAIASTDVRVFGKDTPYEVEIAGGLVPSKRYFLVNDINLSNISYSAAVINGNFDGIFNGNHKAISNLKITSTSNYTGLFAQLSSLSSVSNLTLSNVHASGSITSSSSKVGGLVGTIGSTYTHEKLSFTGSIISTGSGDVEVGGLVGYLAGATIKDSYADVDIQAIGNKIGGLIGYSSTLSSTTPRILNSYVKGTVSSTGGDRVGGLVGDALNIIISESINRAQVVGDINIGGLIGLAGLSSSGYFVNIQNSYNIGVIEGNDQVGGLVGNVLSSDQSVITNSYSIGSVTGTASNIGAVFGRINNATISGVYFNQETSDVQAPIGSESDPSSTGSRDITAAFLASMGTISLYDGWDISEHDDTAETIWEIGSSLYQDTYPWLSWQEDAEDFNELILPPDPTMQALFNQGYIPISSIEDLLAMDKLTIHTFGAETPFEIELMPSNTSKFFLTKDIDLSSIGSWKAMFDIVGFEGTFDGLGYMISYLTVDKDHSDYNINDGEYGLFSELSSGAAISNLTIVDVNFDIASGIGYKIGVLAGFKDNDTPGYATITNVIISGGTIQAESNGMLGGLMGDGNKVNISQSAVILDISSASDAGGLLEDARYVNINQSYYRGNLSSNGNAGGLIASADDTVNINNSYTQGTLSGGSNVGGIVGYYFSGQTYSNFTSMNVTASATTNLGYLFGNIGGGVTTPADPTGNHYYFEYDANIGKFGTDNGYGQASYLESITSQSDATAQSTYSGFDFTNIWEIVETEPTSTQNLPD